MTTDKKINSTVSNKIEKVIEALTKRKITFSANNVIKIVRQNNGPLGSYNFLRDMVHSLFINNNKKFSSVYERILMAVQLPEGRKRIWVYYHKSNNPFDYNPEEIINIKIKDKDVYTFTKDNRVQVPKKLMDEAGFVVLQKVYLRDKILSLDKVYIVDNGLPLQEFLMVNKDNRIRLSKRILEKMFSQSLDNGIEFVVVGNSISITPVI